MNVLRLPDRLFTMPILVRGAVIWASLRAALAVAPWLFSGFEQPFSLKITFGAAVWITLVVGVLGLLELRRRNEILLLANLGFRQRTLAAVAAVPALIGEVVIALAVGDGAARG